MDRLFAPFILTLATAVLVACSPPSTTRPAAGAEAAAAASSDAQAVTVQGTDALKFEPATLTVKAGQPVTLTFANSGQMIRVVGQSR